MTESTLRRHAQRDDRFEAGEIFAIPPGNVTITHGVFSDSLPVAGITVGEFRRIHRDPFDLDDDSRASINNVDVNDDTVLQAGQHLEFKPKAGEKGVA